MEEGGMAGGMMTISRGNVVSRGGKLCDSDVLLMLGVELCHQRILDAAQDHGPAAPIKELFALADRNEGILASFETGKRESASWKHHGMGRGIGSRGGEAARPPLGASLCRSTREESRGSDLSCVETARVECSHEWSHSRRQRQTVEEDGARCKCDPCIFCKRERGQGAPWHRQRARWADRAQLQALRHRCRQKAAKGGGICQGQKRARRAIFKKLCQVDKDECQHQMLAI